MAGKFQRFAGHELAVPPREASDRTVEELLAATALPQQSGPIGELRKTQMPRQARGNRLQGGHVPSHHVRGERLAGRRRGDVDFSEPVAIQICHVDADVLDAAVCAIARQELELLGMAAIDVNLLPGDQHNVVSAALPHLTDADAPDLHGKRRARPRLADRPGWRRDVRRGRLRGWRGRACMRPRASKRRDRLAYGLAKLAELRDELRGVGALGAVTLHDIATANIEQGGVDTEAVADLGEAAGKDIVGTLRAA